MYYFQRRVECVFYIHAALCSFKEISVFYIVMTNLTRASDGVMEFSNLNTQECLCSFFIVLYLLTLSAFGSEAQLEALSPVSPKPLENVKYILNKETC